MIKNQVIKNKVIKNKVIEEVVMRYKQVKTRLCMVALIALAVLSTSFMIVGCSSSKAAASSNKSDIYHLQKKGVSVDRMGEYIMITIPSSLLFDGYSATLSDSANTTLSMVADIVEPMTKVSVKVSAYSSAAKQSQKNLLVTDMQAQNVAHRLWRLGVDTRLMYSTGMGGGHLVSTDKKGLSAGSINSRVVIALRDLSDY